MLVQEASKKQLREKLIASNKHALKQMSKDHAMVVKKYENKLTELVQSSAEKHTALSTIILNLEADLEKAKKSLSKAKKNFDSTVNEKDKKIDNLN